jgi:hypothetical protein
MVFEMQTEVSTSPKIIICTLVQGFKSKDFEIQPKDNLGFKRRILRSRKFEFDSGFKFKGRFEYFQRMEISIRKILKSFRNSEIDLAWT